MPKPGRSDQAKQAALRERQTTAQTARDPDEETTLADVLASLDALLPVLEAIGAKLDDANDKLDTIATNTTPP